MPRVADFNIGRVLAVLFMAWYGLTNLQYRWMFLDNVNLIIHEAGHLLWIPFGEFLTVLGGSSTQIIVPLVFLGYFWLVGQRFAACVVSLWTASSLFNLAVYIADARAMVLPLLGGDNSTHDWNWILSESNVLSSDLAIAGFVRGVGILFLAFSVIAGLYFARGDDIALPWELKEP